MAKSVKVEGYEAFKAAVDEHKGTTIFALFCGSIGKDGKSWCPDCVVAEPVINANLSKIADDGVFIYCSVGDRTFWKDQNNAFRKDPSLMLKGVPTLLKLGQPNRLVEEQCAKTDLVEMLFADD
ncbi:TXD17-like protein [Mya arenaria]|uniref:Thioredoxin domain-containing protein 17 n=1 Tax=Mya arenaria TaxID=6604 RepID=A0ABY7DYF5_MYAAR|nr:thioredoxin domain-containing protein 17-like [Mya arenaria]WAR02767.1 TXD17-like protein [Mya arenaria]